MSAVGRIFPRWRANDAADLEFWVFWSDDISLMLRLSDETLKYRSQAPPKLRAALRPTIAAAMVELSQMKSNYAVLDPLCGTGTLLAECGARFPAAKLFGSDKSPDAVVIATKRLGDKASIRQCAFDNLPHTQGSFDRLITNLPWGKQVPVQQDLYNAGLARMLDWVADDGMVVRLTPRDLLEPSLRRLRARWSATSVRVLGTWLRSTWSPSRRIAAHYVHHLSCHGAPRDADAVRGANRHHQDVHRLRPNWAPAGGAGEVDDAVLKVAGYLLAGSCIPESCSYAETNFCARATLARSSSLSM